MADSFDEWWETSGSHYEAAVIANGDAPWATDLDERRALWDRRYIRPAPPVGLFNNLEDIRRAAA